MARSRKKPCIKDKGMTSHEYWSTIRRTWKQHLKKNVHDPDIMLKNPREIINDCDYSDYTFWAWTEEQEIQYSRK